MLRYFAQKGSIMWYSIKHSGLYSHKMTNNILAMLNAETIEKLPGIKCIRNYIIPIDRFSI